MRKLKLFFWLPVLSIIACSDDPVSEEIQVENQNQIQHFLNSDAGVGFQLDKEQTLLTHNTQGDGFYMAKMTKIS